MAHSVRYEYQLPDGTLADYVLCDRHGRAAAEIDGVDTRVAQLQAELATLFRPRT